MSDNVLSQAEVESLLSAMESGDSRPTTTVQSSIGKSPSAAMKAREKITPYDFKRPERVGKEQMRALQSMHEGFSRNYGAALSGLLRNIVEVKLTSVDQLTYSEFVFSLENPSCFNLLTAEPLEGNLILDINPSILFPIIDRLLGGGKESSSISRRPLTEIELTLVSRITDLFLRELKAAWENVLELDFKVSRVESNPQLVQIVPPNEVVVLTSFELITGDVRGMMNFCIPYNSIERISDKLTSNTWFSFESTEATPETRQQIESRLDKSVVEVDAVLAETKITTEELLDLRVGDIITTERDSRTPIEILVNGQPKFLANLGAHKGRKAIQVNNVLEIATNNEKPAANAAPAKPAPTKAAPTKAAPAKRPPPRKPNK